MLVASASLSMHFRRSSDTRDSRVESGARIMKQTVLAPFGRRRESQSSPIGKFSKWLNRSVARGHVLSYLPVPPAQLAPKSELACLRRREMAHTDQSQAASAPIDGLLAPFSRRNPPVSGHRLSYESGGTEGVAAKSDYGKTPHVQRQL